MRTTIEIADSMLLRARVRARERRISLRSLIEESLAATMDQTESVVEIKPVTFKGKGLSREFAGSAYA